MARLILVCALTLLAGTTAGEPLSVLPADSLTVNNIVEMAIDPAGNIFSGGTRGYASGCRFVKYSPGGTLQWLYDYPSVGGVEVRAAGLATDHQGNMYAAVTKGGLTDSDILVMKFNPNGVKLWERIYNGPAGLTDTPGRIAVSGDHVIVAGISMNSLYDRSENPALPTGETDALLLSYSLTGNLEWATRFTFGENWIENSGEFEVGPDGSLYMTVVAEYRADPALPYPSASKWGVAKFSPQGSALWSSEFPGPTSGFLDISNVCPDQAGNVVVCGMEGDYVNPVEIFFIKYNSEGAELWRSSYDDPSTISGEGRTIALKMGESGDLYVGTGTRVAPNEYDVLLLRYSSEGAFLWERRFHEAAARDYIKKLMLSVTGNPLLVWHEFQKTSVGWQYDVVTRWVELDPDAVVVTENHWGELPGATYFEEVRLDNVGQVVGIGRDASGVKIVRYEASCCLGTTGDLNLSGNIDLTDLSLMIARLTSASPAVMCSGKANLDGVGSMDLTDLSMMIAYMVGPTQPTLAPCQ